MTALLIDGDIVAFKAATVSEHPVHWGDDLWTLHSYTSEAYAYAADMVELLREKSGCTNAWVFFSGKNNFRKNVDPKYKANRIGKRKPICLGPLRERMEETMRCVSFDGLEADDLLGIYGSALPHKTILWSIDKDLRQIAGLHLIDDEVVEISPETADRNFWMQVLVGDTADNYKGCVGVGPVKAEKILSKKDGLTTWEKVLAAYEKAGQTFDDALTNARLAFILRKNQRDTLWEPPIQ